MASERKRQKHRDWKRARQGAQDAIAKWKREHPEQADAGSVLPPEPADPR